jgi:hypothetical protein
MERSDIFFVVSYRDRGEVVLLDEFHSQEVIECDASCAAFPLVTFVSPGADSPARCGVFLVDCDGLIGVFGVEF